MRKTAVILASALLLALAAPMAFAAPIDITGKVETRFEFKQDKETEEWGFGGKTGLKLSPTLHVGENVKMGLELKTHNDAFDDDGNPDRDFVADHKNPELKMSRMWLTTTGPFWQGGPSMTTTIGDQDIKWNEWVAHLPKTRAIAVEDIDLMVAKAGVFYGWDEITAVKDDEGNVIGYTAENPMGLRLASSVAGVDMHGAVVYQDEKVNVAVGAETEIEGVRVNGVAALDADYNYAFKVGASMSPAEDVVLTAGYRQMQDGFNPIHARRDGDHIVPFNKESDESGFNIGVETVQHGFVLGATYDQPTEKATVSAARTFDVYEHAIDAKYEASFTIGGDMEHELAVSTATDLVPYFPGIGLDGKVKLTADNDVEYEVNSSYTAPNGINVGAGYSSADGAVFSGGLKLEF